MIEFSNALVTKILNFFFVLFLITLTFFCDPIATFSLVLGFFIKTPKSTFIQVVNPHKATVVDFNQGTGQQHHCKALKGWDMGLSQTYILPPLFSLFISLLFFSLYYSIISINMMHDAFDDSIDNMLFTCASLLLAMHWYLLFIK